eukprot:7791608-Pyramimonas_sp.AAC.1
MIELPARLPGGSRAVQRRRERLRYSAGLANDAITSLNLLAGRSDHGPARLDSVAQTLAGENIVDSC